MKMELSNSNVKKSEISVSVKKEGILRSEICIIITKEKEVIQEKEPKYFFPTNTSGLC